MFVGQAGQSAVLSCRNLSIGHYMQTVQPIVFIPAMLTGTIDVYHITFTDLDLAMESQVQHKANPAASFLPTLFI